MSEFLKVCMKETKVRADVCVSKTRRLRFLETRILLASAIALIILGFMHSPWAWSNGGYSTDPSNPKYGTHDWIAERALDR